MRNYQRLKVYRNDQRIDGPDVVFHGTATIHDIGIFTNYLGRGIGRHCAYGYGMILLYPPQKLHKN